MLKFINNEIIGDPDFRDPDFVDSDFRDPNFGDPDFEDPDFYSLQVASNHVLQVYHWVAHS